MQAERIEEYLETILYLIKKNNAPAKTKQIADEMNISSPSVTEMIRKLSDEGFVEYKPYYGVEFTKKGALEAARIKRRHQVLEMFLVDILDMDTKVAHSEACKLEHAVSDTVLERICTYIGHPDLCPDGNPIDEGECCIRSKEQYIVLCEMKEGEHGIVSMMTLPPETKERLTSLGLIIGEEVRIKRKQKQGPISIMTLGTEIALGNDIASSIYVNPERIRHRRLRRRGRN
ncbi:MAG TPA: metal-dependent transcriptional regulator [Methanosarcinaceae archaeon]|nr:metal-dependent transcriptional regulator [Methanosarcinaceae archaeon]